MPFPPQREGYDDAAERLGRRLLLLAVNYSKSDPIKHLQASRDPYIIGPDS